MRPKSWLSHSLLLALIFGTLAADGSGQENCFVLEYSAVDGGLNSDILPAGRKICGAQNLKKGAGVAEFEAPNDQGKLVKWVASENALYNVDTDKEATSIQQKVAERREQQINAKEVRDCPGQPSTGAPPVGPGSGVPGAPPTGSPSGGTSQGNAPSSTGASSGVAHPTPDEQRENVSTGGTFNGDQRVGPIAKDSLASLQNAVTLAENTRANEFINNALERRSAFQQAAENDQREIESPYKDLSLPDLRDRFDRAQRSLDNDIGAFEGALSDPNGMDRAEQARFRNLFLNARDKAAAGRDLIDQATSGDTMPAAVTPFNGLLDPRAGNPLAKTQDLADLFLGKQSAASADALTDRLLMYNGLPEDEKKKMFDKLKLAEKAKLKMADGSEKIIDLLHNGYIFGGGKTGTDCSEFVSAALPGDVRKGRFTTLDLRAMWVKQRTGKLPRPPVWKKERAEMVEKAARGFIPVDLYLGDRPIPGDLLIYRLPWGTSGHVFLVKDYNPQTMVARVLEASQSAGTVRERDFPLSIDPENYAIRMVRPGMIDLRLKAVDNGACSYRDKKGGPPRKGRVAASTSAKGGAQ